MRIGILVDELAPGSAPKIIGQSVKNLNNLGHHTEALVLVDKGYSAEFPEIYSYHLNGARVRYLMNESDRKISRINFKFPGFSFFSLYHLTSSLIASSVIKEKEFDCIVAHNPYSAFVARSLYKRCKIPFFMLIWDPSPYTLTKVYSKTRMRYFFPFLSSAAAYLDEFSYEDALAIITSGKLHHKYLRQFTNKPLEILPCGCFPLETLPHFSERENSILSFDRWDVGHKPDMLLEILGRLDKRIKLIVGGFWHPESLKSSFTKKVKERNLENRIEILGPLDEEKIKNLCSKVTLHIHLNEEAFGMQSLEAAGCGCPIIIPKGSGVTDLFEHGVHGYFPEKGNIEEFVKFTNMIFNDTNKTQQLSFNAWQAAKQYTWQEYALRLDGIIKKYVHKMSTD